MSLVSTSQWQISLKISLDDINKRIQISLLVTSGHASGILGSHMEERMISIQNWRESENRQNCWFLNNPVF